MPQLTRSITVSRSASSPKAIEFTVVKATNTLDPAVGRWLSEEAVRNLINSGTVVHVVIDKRG